MAATADDRRTTDSIHSGLHRPNHAWIADYAATMIFADQALAQAGCDVRAIDEIAFLIKEKATICVGIPGCGKCVVRILELARGDRLITRLHGIGPPARHGRKGAIGLEEDGIIGDRRAFQDPRDSLPRKAAVCVQQKMLRSQLA